MELQPRTPPPYTPLYTVRPAPAPIRSPVRTLPPLPAARAPARPPQSPAFPRRMPDGNAPLPYAYATVPRRVRLHPTPSPRPEACTPSLTHPGSTADAGCRASHPLAVMCMRVVASSIMLVCPSQQPSPSAFNNSVAQQRGPPPLLPMYHRHRGSLITATGNLRGVQ